MANAAASVGDIGREFVLRGVLQFTGREIGFRKEAAQEARSIETEVTDAEALLTESLNDTASPGVIDVREAERLRSALRRPGRRASRLATSLTETGAPHS